MRLPRLMLLAVVVVTGCANDQRVALDLSVPSGLDLTTAAKVDIVLAAPPTYPRRQRANTKVPTPNATWTVPPKETVRYLAQQVPAISVDLAQGETVDGLRIQLAIDAGTHYTPIVAVRDANDALLAVGVFDAVELFDVQDEGGVAPAVTTTSGKLAIYQVPLEAAREVRYGTTDLPTTLVKGDVTVVTCGAQPSGIVWRRAADQELRVLLPLDGTVDATPRLTDIDMDCDGEVAGVGDEVRNDCDDTLGTTNGHAAELCNGVDDDCNDKPGYAVTDTCQNACGATSGVCSDITASGAVNQCTGGECGSCVLTSKRTSSGGQTMKRACDGLDHWTPARCMGQSCTATLVYVSDGWDVRIGLDSLGTPNTEQDVPLSIDGAAGQGLAIAAKSSDDYPTTQQVSGMFILVVTANGVSTPYQMTLELVDAADSCPVVPAMTCGT